MSDAFIQIVLLVDYGAKRTESEARAIQWKILDYADKLGVDNTFVEETDAQDD